MQQKTIRLLLRYASAYKHKAGGAVFNSALTVVISSFIGPLIISGILEQIQRGSITLSSVLPALFVYAATQIYGEVVGWRINLYLAWTFETAAQKDLFRDIFKRLSDQSMSFHANRFSGSLVSQTNKMTGAFEKFWDTIIFQLTPTVTSIIAAIVIIAPLFWQYSLFIAVMSGIFITVVIRGSKFLAARNTAEAQASTAMSGRLADVVSNLLTVKSYGREVSELEKATELTNIWRDKALHNMRGFLGISTAYSSMLAIVNVGALVGAIIASERQIISIAVVYLCVTYTFTVARQLWEMNNIMRNYNRIMGDAYDMTEIFSLPTTVVDHSEDELTVKQGRVEIKGLTFAHEKSDDQKALFDSFNLTIKPGERIGLVGHSGSGKTSLSKLLLRFADIDNGVIEIDGQNIAAVTQSSLRRSIAYVPQEPLLFHRSLRENIAYGKPDASERAIIAAAKQANAWEFIEDLPEGLDTTVGERGVKLSGGQRQRIAIARAILKDAPILILDEATSALDSESEKLIQDSLKHLMHNRTSIVIAHRLSTIQHMDRILVMERGRIIEQGAHSDLLTRNGTYAKLWSHQSGGFIDS